jgi:1,4-dihydroxy-2-naphthoyl-CoA hydrolase
MNQTKHIWKQLLTIEQMNNFRSVIYPGQTIMHSLGVKWSKIGDDYIEAVMPVDERTRQPFGILHGGASVVLAESLGSFASTLVAGPDHICVGIEVSASHLRSVASGTVTGRVSPIRLGKALHVWEIKIHETGNEKAGLVCHSKLNVMIRENGGNHQKKVHPEITIPVK